MSSDKPQQKSQSFFNCCSCGDKETQKEAIIDLNKKEPDHTPFTKIYNPNPNRQYAISITPQSHVVRHIKYQNQNIHNVKVHNPTEPVSQGPPTIIHQDQQLKKIHNPLPVYNGPVIEESKTVVKKVKSTQLNINQVKQSVLTPLIHSIQVVQREQTPVVIEKTIINAPASSSIKSKIVFSYSSRPDITKSQVDTEFKVAKLHDQQLEQWIHSRSSIKPHTSSTLPQNQSKLEIQEIHKNPQKECVPEKQETKQNQPKQETKKVEVIESAQGQQQE